MLAAIAPKAPAAPSTPVPALPSPVPKVGGPSFLAPVKKSAPAPKPIPIPPKTPILVTPHYAQSSSPHYNAGFNEKIAYEQLKFNTSIAGANLQGTIGKFIGLQGRTIINQKEALGNYAQVATSAQDQAAQTQAGSLFNLGPTGVYTLAAVGVAALGLFFFLRHR